MKISEFVTNASISFEYVDASAQHIDPEWMKELELREKEQKKCR